MTAGWKVTALVRDRGAAPFLRKPEVTIVEGSVTDHESLVRALPADVDALFHVAGNTSFWSRHAEEQRQVNVDGTSNIYGGAAITELFYNENLGAGIFTLKMTGTLANSGWVTMTVGTTAYTLASAAFTQSGGATQWQWTGLGAFTSSPFSGIGNPTVVVWT